MGRPPLSAADWAASAGALKNPGRAATPRAGAITGRALGEPHAAMPEDAARIWRDTLQHAPHITEISRQQFGAYCRLCARIESDPDAPVSIFNAARALAQSLGLTPSSAHHRQGMDEQADEPQRENKVRNSPGGQATRSLRMSASGVS